MLGIFFYRIIRITVSVCFLLCATAYSLDSLLVSVDGVVKNIACSADGSFVAIADQKRTLLWHVVVVPESKKIGVRFSFALDCLLDGASLAWHSKEKSLMFVNKDRDLLYFACQDRIYLWSEITALGEYELIDALWNVGGNDMIIVSCSKEKSKFVMDEWYKVDNDIHFMVEYSQKFDEIKSPCWNKSGTTFAFIEKGDLILSDRDFDTSALYAWGFFGSDYKKIKTVSWLAGHDNMCVVITDKTGIEILKIRDKNALERLSLFGYNSLSVTTIAVHPIRKCIAAGFKDGIIRIWNLEDLKNPHEHLVINAHVGAVTALTWHPKQDCLFSGSCDGMVGVWDVTEEIQKLSKW